MGDVRPKLIAYTTKTKNRSEFDDFRVTATLKVKDTIISPAMFIITDQGT